jgi:hypothetical protein
MLGPCCSWVFEQECCPEANAQIAYELIGKQLFKMSSKEHDGQPMV